MRPLTILMENLNLWPYICLAKTKQTKTCFKFNIQWWLVINDCVLHHTNPNLPFGGINNSGVGSYHGKFGFDAFSHQKAVMESSGLSPFKLMLPPYTETKVRLANLIKKFF